MKIIFANATEAEIYMATGAPVRVNGQSRDSLTFVMPATNSLDEVDAMFNEAACETVKLVDGEHEYIHKGYTIRVELKKEQVTLSTNVDTPEEITEDVTEDRIFVTMARRTYSEEQVASLTETVDYLVMESLMA